MFLTDFKREEVSQFDRIQALSFMIDEVLLKIVCLLESIYFKGGPMIRNSGSDDSRSEK